MTVYKKKPKISEIDAPNYSLDNAPLKSCFQNEQKYRLRIRIRVIFSSRTHKRTEGRAPVWGFEFTSKRRRTTGGDPAETAVG